MVDTYETLINPERSIPEYISRMTGITDEMVSEAPKFYEVARKLVEITEGTVFVAHNARFDYSFVRQEFQRLGYTYSRKQLCTIRLCKQAFPELPKYGLDHLIDHFDISVTNRHRAMDDARATAIIFEHIMHDTLGPGRAEDVINLGIRESRLPDSITLERLHELPEETGVYYFYDVNDRIVYVGKSINIRKRVMQHFAEITNKSSKMQKRVHDIDFEITGSELAALLLENHEIKKHQPEINRAMRTNSYPYALYAYMNGNGYWHLGVNKINRIKADNPIIIREFAKSQHAKGKLKSLVAEHTLCLNMSALHTGPGPCFKYHIEECNGACIGEEPHDDYNRRVETMIEAQKQSLEGSAILVDEGREPGERALIGVRDGSYYGFGYINEGEPLANIQEAFTHIKQYKPTPESMKIISHFLDANKLERVIHF